ncbi:AraC family transcriptional regulator [Paenibacillus sp. D2_2]|nr:AraC family transcriptional regulator [Paenibacillus sp. D2_2]WMT43058.1 AraC family transcriptional regulator [Paenibacillus sp. D2_2]
MHAKEKLHPNDGLIATSHLHKTDLQEIKAYIGTHYDESLSITQLARMANISPKYFVDLFKKTFGQSAMEYLTDVRIHHAKRYLAESDERLRDIAKKVGYKDEFYFSRKFKKEVGMSPTDFVKNTRKRVAVCSPSAIGHLLALNIIPEIAPLDPKWTPHYYNLYSGKIKSHLILTSPYYELAFETNLDKLSQARPDVIIGSDQMRISEGSRLNSIAPVHYIAGNKGWRDQLLDIANYLDKEAVAEQWIRNYENNVEIAKAQMSHSLGDDRIIALRIYRTQMFVYRNRGLHEVLYEDLNLQAACGKELSGHLPITLQELQELDPERILLIICPEALTRKYWLTLQHSEGWKRLRAVQNSHVYMISADPWFEYSSVAMARMLDEALLLFTGNCPNILLDYSYGESLAK